MTAPAIAQAPAVAPVAPVIETPVTAPVVAPAAPVTPAPETVTPPSEPGSVQSMIEKIARKATPEGDAFAAQSPDTPPAEPSAVDTVIPPAGDAPPADGTPPVMVSEITADDGDGEIVLRARDPKTGQFSEMDQTRTYELSRRDKATGETRVYNKTLPEVLRLANDGIGMQKSREELTYYRENVQQWQQAHTTIQQEAEGYRALALELLTAPEEHVVLRRDAYAAEQSPEKQNARLQAELRAERAARAQQASAMQQREQQAQIGQHVAALRAKIGPITAEVEKLVGQEAAAGKLALETAHLMVNGKIPPQHFPQLEQYVAGPYRQWAQAEAAKRSSSQAEIEKQKAATLETQRNAQLAAQRAGAATRPGGGVAGAPVALPKAKNVNETIERIIRRPVAQAG